MQIAFASQERNHRRVWVESAAVGAANVPRPEASLGLMENAHHGVAQSL